MVVQGGEFLEGSAAFGADVGLLGGVVQHVLVVGLLKGEGFVALGAEIWHLS